MWPAPALPKGSHRPYLLNQELTKGRTLGKGSPGSALPCHKISMLCDFPNEDSDLFLNAPYSKVTRLRPPKRFPPSISPKPGIN